MYYAAICVLIITGYSAVGAQEYTCNETTDCLSCLSSVGCGFWSCVQDLVSTNVSQCQRITEAEPTLPCIYGGMWKKIDNRLSCPANNDNHSTNWWKIFTLIMIAIFFAAFVIYIIVCMWLWYTDNYGAMTREMSDGVVLCGLCGVAYRRCRNRCRYQQI